MCAGVELVHWTGVKFESDPVCGKGFIQGRCSTWVRCSVGRDVSFTLSAFNGGGHKLI